MSLSAQMIAVLPQGSHGLPAKPKLMLVADDSDRTI